MKRQLTRLVSKLDSSVRLMVIFKPICKFSNILCHLKSPIPLLCKSNVVYRIDCDNCPEFYIGLTQRRLEERLAEHHSSDKSSVFRHCQSNQHEATSVRVITTECNKEKLYIKESIAIQENRAYVSLNQHVSSFNLQLW